MASTRKTQAGAGARENGAAGKARIPPAAADAQALMASTDGDRKDAGHQNRVNPEPQDGAPTVGKTGGRGARAERPSPVSDRKQAARPLVEVTRTGKPPAETPKARHGRGGPKAAAA